MPDTTHRHLKNQSRAASPQGDIHPFMNAEEAWFWFIAAQEARNDGARFVSGIGLYNRPCEPLDILKVLDRLYRKRTLERAHFLVLRHYGRRHMAPDPHRIKEERAYRLWHEALRAMTPILEAKGIIESQKSPCENWVQEALIFESTKEQTQENMQWNL